MGELWSHPAHDGASAEEDAPTGTVKLVVAPKDSDDADGAAGNAMGSDDATDEQIKLLDAQRLLERDTEGIKREAEDAKKARAKHDAQKKMHPIEICK